MEKWDIDDLLDCHEAITLKIELEELAAKVDKP